MLTVEDDGAVRVVTLDRPDRRNAVTPAALDALREAVTEAPTPVVYRHGAGDAFCAATPEATGAEPGVTFGLFGA